MTADWARERGWGLFPASSLSPLPGNQVYVSGQGGCGWVTATRKSSEAGLDYK